MADTTIPGPRDEMIEFYVQHAEIWSASAVDIGLTLAQATAVADAATAAQAALDAATAARNASKVQTSMLNDKAASLRSVGGAAVAQIRAFAEITDNPDVYDKAQITPPAPPTPVGPPTSPADLTADPHADGTISLRWKGTVSGGQSFVIERSIDMGAWGIVRSVREKSWLDNAVPMNTNNIRYRVYGMRGDTLSVNPPITSVNFGNLPAAIAAAFKTTMSEAA